MTYKFTGNHETPEAALEHLRTSVANMADQDTDTWPEHGDAAMAILGMFCTRAEEAASWRRLPPEVVEIAAERRKQVSNGYDCWHDYRYNSEGQLLIAAECHIGAIRSNSLDLKPSNYPEDWHWPKAHSRREHLIRAASFLLAEAARAAYHDEMEAAEQPAAAPEVTAPEVPVAAADDVPVPVPDVPLAVMEDAPPVPPPSIYANAA